MSDTQKTPEDDFEKLADKAPEPGPAETPKATEPAATPKPEPAATPKPEPVPTPAPAKPSFKKPVVSPQKPAPQTPKPAAAKEDAATTLESHPDITVDDEPSESVVGVVIDAIAAAAAIAFTVLLLQDILPHL